jgi:acetate kinase
MLGALGGLDAVVFTAGVGEHSAEVRAGALEPFAFLGVQLDRARNARGEAEADIAADSSPLRVLVIRAREEWAIARAPSTWWPTAAEADPSSSGRGTEWSVRRRAFAG